MDEREEYTSPLVIKRSQSTKWDEAGDYGIIDSEGRVVGEAFLTVGKGVLRPALANARLWASAPDLLRALKGLLVAADKGERSYYNAEQVARAAIAKAEGDVS